MFSLNNWDLDIWHKTDYSMQALMWHIKVKNQLILMYRQLKLFKFQRRLINRLCMLYILLFICYVIYNDFSYLVIVQKMGLTI